jgi:hypothetical protein
LYLVIEFSDKWMVREGKSVKGDDAAGPDLKMRRDPPASLPNLSIMTDIGPS